MHVSVNKAVTNAQNSAAVATESAQNKSLFEGSRAAFRADIESIEQPLTNLTKWSAKKTISCSDMRIELGKVETALAKLMADKTKLLNMDPTADLTA